MLMGEKLIHSQMKVFRELRPGVSVIGIENGYAMPAVPLRPTRHVQELASFRLFSKGINVHVAGVSQNRPTTTANCVGRSPRRTPNWFR